MAEERVPEIVVPLRYDYNDEGLKIMSEDIAKLGKGKGVKSAKKNLEAITTLFKASNKTFSFDSEKVVSAYNKTTKAIDNAIKKQKEYDKATASVSGIKRQITAGKLPKNTPKLTTALETKNTKWIEYQQSITKAAVAFQNLTVAQDRAQKIALSDKELQNANKLKTTLAEQEQQEKQYRQEQINLYTQLFGVIDENEQKQKEAAKEQERIAKETAEAQAQAEKEAAEAAKQAAKEQEEAKERVRNAWKTLGDSVKNVGKKFRQGIQSFAATLYVLRRITNFIKSISKEISNLISASSSWVENLNLLEVVFADVSENAESTKKWVSELAHTFSMDKNAIVQYVSTFKQMANAMGQVSTTGETMSKVLTQLGLDIASLRNVKTETAMSDLASAIAGQIKPVRKYGFDITQQSINALLQESGIGGTASTLSQADKQLARTILLIRQSRDAWGDLGKTINTFANQQRVLNDQWETTKRLLGQVFLGTFQFGDSLEEAEKTAGIATRIIWRINGALIAFNQILEAILPSADSVNGAIATGAEEAADAIEEENAALENSLASFDKFNVMSSGSNAVGTGTSLENLFSREAQEYMDAFSKRAKEIESYSRKIAYNFLDKLFPAFAKWRNGDDTKSFAEWADSSKEARESIEKTLAPIKQLKEAIEDITGYIGENFFDIMKAIVDIVSGIIKFITPILKWVGDVARKLGADGIARELKFILFAIIAIKGVGIITSAFTGIVNITKVLKDLTPVFDTIGTKLNSLMGTSNELGNSLGNVGGTITGLAIGVASLSIGIASMANNWDDMSTSMKVATIAAAALTSVLIGVAVAKAALASGLEPITAAIRGVAVGAIIAGGILTLGSSISAMANKHAQGGYQTGGLFYAGENGAEWVGRQGNTSTIVNDKQMSDIMQQSVAMGVVQGNRMSNGGRTTSDNKPIVVNVDGQKLFEVVERNGKKVGKVFVGA